MTAPVSFTRPTYTDSDSLQAADFNAITAVNATVRDATDTLAGVVTLAGDLAGTAATPAVAANAITLAKLQDIATLKVVGRQTAGTGDPELLDCTAAGAAMIAAVSNAAQRNLLAGTAETVESDLAASSGITQNFTVAASTLTTQVFNTANAPSIALTAGTWLVTGSLLMSSSSVGTPAAFYAKFRNDTDGADFGGSPAANGDGAQRIYVSGVITVASGTKTIHFKVFAQQGYSSSESATLGFNNGPAGYITAAKLF